MCCTLSANTGRDRPKAQLSKGLSDHVLTPNARKHSGIEPTLDKVAQGFV